MQEQLQLSKYYIVFDQAFAFILLIKVAENVET